MGETLRRTPRHRKVALRLKGGERGERGVCVLDMHKVHVHDVLRAIVHLGQQVYRAVARGELSDELRQSSDVPTAKSWRGATRGGASPSAG